MSTRIQGYEPGPELADNENGYRYFVDGELIENFDDEGSARRFFAKDKANCEALANEHGCQFKRILFDDTGYNSKILESDFVGVEHELVEAI